MSMPTITRQRTTVRAVEREEVAMQATEPFRRALQWSAVTMGVAAGAYGACVAAAYYGYGHPSPPAPEDADPLLDRFMPVYDVADRHRIRIAAPADITFAAACEQDLMALAPIRAIFTLRELTLGARPDASARPRGLLALTKSLGWGVLAEEPGREVVMGAVTQPWQANVVFRPVPPADFAEFAEPDMVKIVWTLRAEPAQPSGSIFRIETRAIATDATARANFRWYWARFSPGIVLIRRLSLGLLRRNAERRAGLELRCRNRVSRAIARAGA